MKNKLLKIIYFANGIFVFASALLFPIFALFLSNFNVDIIQISFTSTIFLISTAFFLVLLSIIGDKTKHIARYVLLGYLIRTIVWTSYIFVDQIWQIYILQIILGLGEAIGSTFFSVFVAEHLDEGKHVQDYSVWKLIESFCAAVAATIGGFIVEIYSFQVLFGIMAILSLVCSLIFYFGMTKSSKIPSH